MALDRLRARLRRLLQVAPDASGKPSATEVEAWNRALSEEIDFWRGVIQDPTHPHAGDIPWRLLPDFPLQSYLTDVLADSPHATVRILDVGAGPATVVGKVWPGREVQITAIDPLAERYNEMFKSVGVTPPVRTQFGHAEKLASQFPTGSFDLVFSHNALDHSYAPLIALEQALEILRPGGAIFLRHNENEAVHAAYTGLHQWNFSVEANEFVIWNRSTRLLVSDHLRLSRPIETRRWLNPESGDTMIDVVIRAAS